MEQRRSGSSSPAAIERATQERRAVELRTSGATFEQIRADMGLANRGCAHRLVTRGLTRWMLEANEDLRALELERSDVVIARLWPSIDCENPDPKAIEQYLRVCDYRAKIAGLYAPKKTLFSEERPWGPAGAPTRLAAVDELCAATGTWITITDHLVDQAAARYAVVADGPNHRGARAVPDEPDNSPAGDNNAASGSSDTRSAEQTPRSARASGDDGETDIHRGAFHRVPAADSTTQPAPADPPSTIDGHNAGADETPLERAKRRVREGDIPPRTLRLPRRE